MASLKSGSNKDRKGKKPHKNKLTSKKYAFYSVSGDSVKRDKKFCPRCGPGIFLAQHKDRLHCGKCNYTEFVKG